MVKQTESVEIKLTITMTPALAKRYADALVAELDHIEGSDVHGPEFDVATASLSQLVARLFDRQGAALLLLQEASELQPELLEQFHTFGEAL